MGQFLRWLKSTELEDVDVGGMTPAHIRVAVVALRVILGVLVLLGWLLLPWLPMLVFAALCAAVVAVLVLERALVRKLQANRAA